jgi:hypothetical protein
MGPNVKINVLGESAQRPLVATAGTAAPFLVPAQFA